jgi:hypothetical protein
MFKEQYEPGPIIKKETISVAEEGRLKAIDQLKAGAQDESKPVTLRLIRVKSLIQLLNEQKAAHPSDKMISFDIVQAETYRDELLRGTAANDSSLEEDKKLA